MARVKKAGVYQKTVWRSECINTEIWKRGPPTDSKRISRVVTIGGFCITRGRKPVELGRRIASLSLRLAVLPALRGILLAGGGCRLGLMGGRFLAELALEKILLDSKAICFAADALVSASHGVAGLLHFLVRPWPAHIWTARVWQFSCLGHTLPFFTVRRILSSSVCS